MATATLPTITDLDDLEAHPLCTVIRTGKEATCAYRFGFVNAVSEDGCDDEDMPKMAALFLADGIPFTVTVDEPIDEEALAAEAAEDARELALLWYYHGPGR